MATTSVRAEPKYISIGTASPNGVYFVAGQAICRNVHKSATEGVTSSSGLDLRCAAPSTAGSIHNLEMLRTGNLDFGIVQSDWQFHAWKGTDKFENRQFKDLRALFSMHAEPFQLVAAKGTGIRSWGDLKGKRVNIGNKGSGHFVTMEALMKAFSTERKDFAAVTLMDSSQQSRALCEGRIDAFVYAVGVPNSGMAVATNGCGARIISLDGAPVFNLVAQNKYYAFVKIPSGTYRTVTSDVTTFGVKATLVTRSSQPDTVVHRLVRAIFENLDDFRNQHPAFGVLKAPAMIRDGLSAPVHPGAMKFYREKGWR